MVGGRYRPVYSLSWKIFVSLLSNEERQVSLIDTHYTVLFRDTTNKKTWLVVHLYILGAFNSFQICHRQPYHEEYAIRPLLCPLKHQVF